MVNAAPLLATPFTVTTMLPVVAPDGTVAVIELSLHRVGVAATPLNVTVLAPCDNPKVEPVIVITAPTAPASGDKLVIDGPPEDPTGVMLKNVAGEL